MTPHPSCDHPVSNMSDDYLGVTCCCCDGRPCEAVTPEQLAAHDVFMAHLLGAVS